MPEPFKPSAREQALIDAAQAAAEHANKEGHHAPRELVRRMTDEGKLDGGPDDEHWRVPRLRWTRAFYFLVELVFQPLPAVEHVAETLAGVGCRGVERRAARCSKGECLVLAFEVEAPSEDSALRKAFTAIEQAFPGGRIGDFGRPSTQPFQLRDTVGDAIAVSGPRGPRSASEPCDFGVIVATAVTEPVSRDVALAQLSPAGCVNAESFKRRPVLFVAEFMRSANSREEAEVTALEAVLELVPDARPVEVGYLYGASIQALKDISRDGWLTEDEIDLALVGLEGLADAPGATQQPGGDRSERRQLAEVDATVFEVLDGFRLAHLRADDGRILVLTQRTPGVLRFEDLEEGQVFRCMLELRFNLVLRTARVFPTSNSSGEASPD